MVSVTGKKFSGSSIILIINHISRKGHSNWQLYMTWCINSKVWFPFEYIEVDLMVFMLKGIHTYKKDYKTEITQYSRWGAKVWPYLSFRRKMKKTF